MTGVNHGMTGAVIALTIKQPALAVPLSFISHYITDMFPHYGPPLSEVLGRKFNIFHIVDFFFSLMLMAILGILFPSHIWIIWACMIAAAIPDGIWWFYRKTVKKWPISLDRFTRFHLSINVRTHQKHLYFDAIWFAAMWLAVLLIKFQ